MCCARTQLPAPSRPRWGRAGLAEKQAPAWSSLGAPHPPQVLSCRTKVRLLLPAWHGSPHLPEAETLLVNPCAA